MTVNTSSNPTKKRKVNDGRDDVPDSTHDVSNDGGGFFTGRGDDASAAARTSGEKNKSTTSQLDRMEQMMMRMEEKLATVSSLESRCEQLEAKCSSLESKLESTSQAFQNHVDSKIDSLRNDLKTECSSLESKLESGFASLQDRAQKYQEYNEMLVRNQSWEYSAEIINSYDPYDYGDYEDRDVCEFLGRKSNELKDKTIKMRRGEFPDVDEEEGEDKGIYLNMDEDFFDIAHDNLLPHLKEFIAAIKQFTPVMNLLPDNCDCFFEAINLQLNQDTKMLIKEALIGKPFTKMCFVHNDAVDESGGIGMDAIIDVLESNQHLRKLEIYHDHIQRNHIERLCNVVHNRPLMELRLWNSINDPATGNAMLTSLLTSGDLKLEKLEIMYNNGINSDVNMLLADFIATNQRMKELEFTNNELNDNDAALIANALRSNKTLRKLRLAGNGITESGCDVFRPVLWDKSSLNAVADSNHCCLVFGVGRGYTGFNSSEVIEENRGRKIYSLLSERHLSETMSNVQHFCDIDVKVLPNLLEAVQKYSKIEIKDVKDDPDLKVGSLSIVYEVMRKWDKMFSIYASEHEVGENTTECGYEVERENF